MINKDMLNEIHRDNKSINRNLQRLVNIGLIGLLGKCAEKARRNDDKAGKILVKTGFVLVALTEILLLISDFADFRKEK